MISKFLIQLALLWGSCPASGFLSGRQWVATARHPGAKESLPAVGIPTATSAKNPPLNERGPSAKNPPSFPPISIYTLNIGPDVFAMKSVQPSPSGLLGKGNGVSSTLLWRRRGPEGEDCQVQVDKQTGNITALLHGGPLARDGTPITTNFFCFRVSPKFTCPTWRKIGTPIKRTLICCSSRL